MEFAHFQLTFWIMRDLSWPLCCLATWSTRYSPETIVQLIQPNNHRQPRTKKRYYCQQPQLPHILARMCFFYLRSTMCCLHCLPVLHASVPSHDIHSPIWSRKWATKWGANYCCSFFRNFCCSSSVSPTISSPESCSFTHSTVNLR